MEVQTALWNIVKKTYFYDFSFSTEFIEMIKTDPKYDGLFHILNLIMDKKLLLESNSAKEIKTSNPCPIVQLIIDIYTTKFSIYMAKENTLFRRQKLDQIYEELDRLSSVPLDDSCPYINILMLLSFTLEKSLGLPQKYSEHKIKQQCGIFSKIFIAWSEFEINSDVDTIDIESDIFETEYPNTATRFIKYVSEKTQLVIDGEDTMKIANCCDILFPDTDTNQLIRKYNDMYKFVCLCEELSNRSYKIDRFEKQLLSYLRYTEYSNFIIHEIKMLKLRSIADIPHNGSEHIKYFKKLFESNSKFFTPEFFFDYISLLYNQKDFQKVYDIFKKHEKYTIYRIQSTSCSINIQLNIMLAIIISGTRIHKSIPISEFCRIIEKIDVATFPNQKAFIVYKQIIDAISEIKDLDFLLSNIGFNIVNESKVGETCYICLSEIDDSNTQTIECISCKKEVGHLVCMAKWIVTNQSCPLCRSTTQQRQELMKKM